MYTRRELQIKECALSQDQRLLVVSDGPSSARGWRNGGNNVGDQKYPIPSGPAEEDFALR